MKKLKKKIIYLDDVRTPVSKEWIVVRNYEEFIAKIHEIGLDNIEMISLDHDLGPSAMKEFSENVKINYELNYLNISEKTGLDCAKWLVQYAIENGQKLPQHIYSHSANPIGSANIIGYINNYYNNNGMKQNSIRVRVEFK